MDTDRMLNVRTRIQIGSELEYERINIRTIYIPIDYPGFVSSRATCIHPLWPAPVSVRRMVVGQRLVAANTILVWLDREKKEAQFAQLMISTLTGID